MSCQRAVSHAVSRVRFGMTVLIAVAALAVVMPLSVMALPGNASSPEPKKKHSGGNAAKKEFVVVLDAGHGGHDVGATDHGAREKDINLSVVLKAGEMIEKKLKNTRVVYTRDDDSFVSLQGRADIANKCKADLFISVHTNSVDRSNRNRANIEGASVYALGLHKDDNNMSVARRENSVIELEGKDYEQKYSGFDPNKDESYIIFEMAQKRNLAQSIRFANEIQRNLVDVAGRKDRGVHQAGFWVLWATSMPSVLVELDFICNPSSTKFLTSDSGVNKLAQAIFESVKKYEEKYYLKTGMGTVAPHDERRHNAVEGSVAARKTKESTVRRNRSVEEIMADSKASGLIKDTPVVSTTADRDRAGSRSNDFSGRTVVAQACGVRRDTRDVSHSMVSASSRSAYTGNRRRRSAKAAAASANRRYEYGDIRLFYESSGENVISQDMAVADDRSDSREEAVKSIGKQKKGKYKAGKKHSEAKKAVKKRDMSARRRGSNMQTVYTIQILSSEDKLTGSSPDFHGLSPVYAFRENNVYKYTYGEAQSREEIEPLLKKVKEKIPDAFVISKIRSKR